MYISHAVNESVFVIIHPLCCFSNYKRRLGVMAGILMSPGAGAAAGGVCSPGPLIQLILLLILVTNDVVLSDAGVFIPPVGTPKAYMWTENARVAVGANVTFYCTPFNDRMVIIRTYILNRDKTIPSHHRASQKVNSTTWAYHITGVTEQDTNVYVCKYYKGQIVGFQYLEVMQEGTAEIEPKIKAPSTLDCVSERYQSLMCTWNQQKTSEGAVSWQVSIWKEHGSLKEFKCAILTKSKIRFDVACSNFKFFGGMNYYILIEPNLNGEKMPAQVYCVKPRLLVNPGKIDRFVLQSGSRETRLSWTKPMDAVDLEYNITVYKEGDEIKSYPFQTSTSLKVTDLKPYTNYSAVVVTKPVKHFKGFPTRSEIHWTSKQAAPEAPPTNVTLHCTADTANISWSPPAVRNGVINYTVTMITEAGIKTRTTTDTSWYEVDLVGYTDYQVRIIAATPGGESPSSVMKRCKTDEKAPSPVRKLNVIGVKKSQYLGINWERPKYPNSRSLTYRILVTWITSNKTVVNETVPEGHQRTPESQLKKEVKIECPKSIEDFNVSVQVAAVSFLGMRSHWRSKELQVYCADDPAEPILLVWLIPLMVLILLGMVVFFKFGKCKARVKKYFCIEPVFPDVDLNFQVQGQNEYYWQCDEGIVATEETDDEQTFSTDSCGSHQMSLPSNITRPVNMQSADSGIMERDSEDTSTENDSQGMSNDIPYATIVGTIGNGADDHEGEEGNRSKVMNRRSCDVSDTWLRQTEQEKNGDAETRAFSDAGGPVDLCTRHGDDTDYYSDQYVTSRIHLTIPGENTVCNVE